MLTDLLGTAAFFGVILLWDYVRYRRGTRDNSKPTADYFGVDARM